MRFHSVKVSTLDSAMKAIKSGVLIKMTGWGGEVLRWFFFF